MGFRIILVGFLWWAPAAQAQNAETILEQGQYAEETMGDLQAAINLYKSLAADPAIANKYRASAILRMASTYLKLDQKDVACALLGQLIKDYPAEVELVAQAKQLLGEKPAALQLNFPWATAETLVYRESSLKAPGSAYSLMVMALKQSARGWQTWAQRYRGIYPIIATSQLGKQLYPISSQFLSHEFGLSELSFKGSALQVVTSGKTVQQELRGKYFLESSFFYVLRSVTLKLGDTFQLPIYAEALSMPFDMDFTVANEEFVTVPAGSFPCFRLETTVGFVLWVAQTDVHQLVKVTTPEFSSELAQVSQRDALTERSLVLPDGSSMDLAAGWFAYQNAAPAQGTEIDILAPHLMVSGKLRFVPRQESEAVGELKITRLVENTSMATLAKTVWRPKFRLDILFEAPETAMPTLKPQLQEIMKNLAAEPVHN